MNLGKTLAHLSSGGDLSETRASELLSELVETDAAPVVVGAILAALRTKGESARELWGFSRAMTSLCLPFDIGREPERRVVDICGTVRDAVHGSSLSMGLSIMAVSCGLDVVRQTGLFASPMSRTEQFIRALGVSGGDDPESAILRSRVTGLGLLSVGSFHSALEPIFSMTEDLGIETLLDVARALANPARPEFLYMAAETPERAVLISEALAGAGVGRAFVTHGESGWPEATSLGPFRLWEIREGGVTESLRDPADWGLPRCLPEDLVEGDIHVHAERLTAVLECRASGPLRDTLVLGTSLVLELCGVVEDPGAGMVLARRALDDGRARGVLAQLRQPLDG